MNLDGGVLYVVGTSGADSVAFAEEAGGVVRVVMNGADSSFDRAAISSINISMLAGPDTVILGSLDIPAFIRGGAGDDSLSGGDGNDTIFGDGGFDYVFGRAGSDELHGGIQYDLLIGGRGDDLLIPLSDNGGDDTLSGSQGIDTADFSDYPESIIIDVSYVPNTNAVEDVVYPDIERILGTPGDDTLINGTGRGIYFDGQAGNDTLLGGSGPDTLIGGIGQDLLRGFAGDDRFGVADGESDTVFGGSGSDALLDPADPSDVINEVP